MMPPPHTQSTLRRPPSMRRPSPARVALWIVELLPALLFAAVYFRRAEHVSWRPWVLRAAPASASLGPAQLAFASFSNGGRTLEVESWDYHRTNSGTYFNHHGWHRIDVKSRITIGSQALRESALLNPHVTYGSDFNGALLTKWNTNQSSRQIELFDVSEGALKRRRLKKITASATVGTVASAPDSNSIAIAVENRCEVRDARSGLLRFTLRAGDTSSIAWSSDGTTIATSGAALRLWDARDGRPLGKVWLGAGYPNASSVSFSPDGKIVAAIDGSGQLQLRGARDAHLIHRIRYGSLGGPLLFSPDGRLLACGENSSQSGFTHIFDVATASHRRTLRAAGMALNPIAWSPDGTYLVTRTGQRYGSSDDALIMWRVRAWNGSIPTSSNVNTPRKPANTALNTVIRGY